MPDTPPGTRQPVDFPRSSRQLIERFRQLPVVSREVWQGAVVRLPAWIDSGGGAEPYRPFGALWASATTGRITVELERKEGGRGPELLLAGLLRFAKQEKKVLGGRSGRLEVGDASTRDWLHDALGGAAHVEAVPRLDAVSRALRDYTDFATEDQPPSALEGAGVTLEVLEVFADAAAVFYAAAPWQHLSDEDLIEVETPRAPRGFRFALVLGNAGHTFGLAFYASREQHEAMMRGGPPPDAARAGGADAYVPRSIIFDPAHEVPIKDHDLWLEHGLPLAGPRAYPFAAHYHGGHRATRFGREELEFAGAVLRALAVTTEDEMDSGRWGKQVTSAGLTATVRLSLPGVLEPGRPGEFAGPNARRRSFERSHAEIQRFLEGRDFASVDEVNAAIAARFGGRRLDEMPSTARTDAERAQDLTYQAYDWVGRRRIALAKQALALWPDCAEAYVILAEHASTPERALPLYEEAAAAGRRALGGKLETLAGELWGHVEARPYMRARLGLAQTLEALGREEEAIAHMQELLRLNTGDNQGVRNLLVPRLLERGRREDAASILAMYPNDVSATVSYCAALAEFQAGGDGEAAQAALKAAYEKNPFVPGFLLDPVEDDDIESFALGSEEEGIVSAGEMAAAWKATPGALDWLAGQVLALNAHRRAAARRRGKKERKRGR